MGPLSYLIAFVAILFGAYYWHKMNKLVAKAHEASRQNKTTSKAKSAEKFLDFDKDCKIRALTTSDLDTLKLMAKGQGGCNYFKTRSFLPYLDESNEQCLGFGVEHKDKYNYLHSIYFDDG